MITMQVPYFKPHNKLRQCLRLFCWAALSLGLSGCSMLGGVANVVASSTADVFSGSPSSSFLDWKGLTIVSTVQANQNSPLALDLVFVRDAATLEKLLSLPASRWFASKAELQKTYPQAFEVRSWELVPQQVLRLDDKALGSPRVAGMLVFADYLSPGEHRAQLPLSRESFMVELGERSFSVQASPR